MHLPKAGKEVGMTVIVESKRLKVTQALRTFIEGQARKITKLGERVSRIRVHLETIGKKSNDPLANSVTYHLEIPGKDIVVRRRAVDMYEAVVDATRSAIRHLRKLKEKRVTTKRHLRKGASGVEVREDSPASGLDDSALVT
jgi:ribosomal subunit interface protein